MQYGSRSIELCCMKCILIISVFIFSYMDLYAQTPIEDLITRYRDCSGAQCFVADNDNISPVHEAFATSPLSPIADDVTSFYILKMASAPLNMIEGFRRNIDEILRTYYTDFSADCHLGGNSHAYVSFLDKDVVSELVIYNPSLLILNDIQGEFDINSLKIN